MKKIVALLIAATLVLATMGVALAAGLSSITVNNAVKGHTYYAYQIFKGDFTGGKLTNIDWGPGITDAGKTALYAEYNLTGADQTAEKVAESIGSSAADAIAFANVIDDKLDASTNVKCEADGTITFSNMDDGYYLILDEWTGDANAVEGNDYSLARIMVQVAGDATVNNKADKPTVEKKIVEGTERVENNTANIGDAVNYELTSNVPNYSDYKEYYVTFTDKLSKGLDFNNDVKVSIGGTELTSSQFTVESATDITTKETTFTVKLKDFVNTIKPTTGAAIVVTYSATVNDDAVIGDAGNPNEVKLTYSNNPLDSGDGTPDNNNDGVTGETPKQTVKTFVTGLALKKIDGADNTKVLSGARFTIKGSEINKVLISGDEFVEDASGTYYKLTDGTYTDKAPTTATESNYADTTKKYKKQAYTTDSVQETKDVEFEVVTDSTGYIKIDGLKEGTYTFTEIQAPDGYNLLKDPIVVVISSNIADVADDSSKVFAWSATKDGTDVLTANSTFEFEFSVENMSGIELPSTGGIGTTIFYISGLVMVLGAAAILVARRKAESEA